jgi:CrcB protein
MPRSGSTLTAVAAGGVLGAEARYGLTVALPYHGGQFPVSTLLINVTGSLLIGLLMAWLEPQRSPHPLLRPFLGVGVLAGYTTYSGFAVDVQQLLLAHRPLVAVGYLAATVLGCATAVWLASTLVAGSAVPTRLPDATGSGRATGSGGAAAGSGGATLGSAALPEGEPR